MIGSVAVIIVTWNGLEHLQRCLPALMAQEGVAFETLVVDNGSTDGTVPWLRETYPDVRLVVNAENVGFAEANNQGIRATSARYVVLLNNDATPAPGWLCALVAAGEREDRVGMVASQICFAHDPERLDSAGIEVDVLGIAWNRHLGGLVSEEPVHAVEVFGPSAAAALYSRPMLDEIGPFDARYFAYYEDVELAWRARRAGWRCLYAPAARVAHVHSATGGRIAGFKHMLLGRNKWRTLFKHYPFRRLWNWFPLLLAVDGVTWAWPLISRLDTAPLRGRWAAWKDWHRWWNERGSLDLDDAFCWLRPPDWQRLLWGWKDPLKTRPHAKGNSRII